MCVNSFHLYLEENKTGSALFHLNTKLGGSKAQIVSKNNVINVDGINVIAM